MKKSFLLLSFVFAAGSIADVVAMPKVALARRSFKPSDILRLSRQAVENLSEEDVLRVTDKMNELLARRESVLRERNDFSASYNALAARRGRGLSDDRKLLALAQSRLAAAIEDFDLIEEYNALYHQVKHSDWARLPLQPLVSTKGVVVESRDSVLFRIGSDIADIKKGIEQKLSNNRKKVQKAGRVARVIGRIKSANVRKHAQQAAHAASQATVRVAELAADLQEFMDSHQTDFQQPADQHDHWITLLEAMRSKVQRYFDAIKNALDARQVVVDLDGNEITLENYEQKRANNLGDIMCSIKQHECEKEPSVASVESFYDAVSAYFNAGGSSVQNVFGNLLITPRNFSQMKRQALDAVALLVS